MALRIKAVLMSEDIPTFVRKFVKARMKSNVVNISRVSSGKRADTYFVDSKNKRYVLQFYGQNLRYQPSKRRYIYEKVRNNTKVLVPEVISIGKFRNLSYLIMEGIDGKTFADEENELKRKEKEYILETLGKYIAEFQNKIHIGKRFGWIEDTRIISQGNSNIGYLKSEVTRIVGWLNKTKNERQANLIRDYFSEKLGYLKKDCNPVLTWSEINKTNMLLQRGSSDDIKLFLLDPGSAKSAPKEIDLLAAESEFAPKDYAYIMKGYKSKNGKLDKKNLEIYRDYIMADTYSYKTMLKETEDKDYKLVKDYLVEKGML